MIIKTSSNTDVLKAKEFLEKLISQDCKFEIKKLSNTRTSQQNRALHLYYTIIANELNEMGQTFVYDGLNKMNLESRYTTDIVKEFIWRPIQIAMFNIKSTTKIDTKQINEIVDVVTKYFGDRGVNLEFPSIETLMNKK